MNYKYLNNIETVESPCTTNKTLKVVTILREGISNVSVHADYNPVTDCNAVILKVRKDSKVIESRTLIDCTLFPKHLKRTKKEIKIYLESFRNETQNI